MLPTFVIGLREGLEASLIVGIIAAFLGKQGRRDLLRWVMVGVVTAVALCVGVGVALEVLARNLPQRQQEGLETVVGVLAVAMVTYMVVWMRRNSRQLKGTLEQAAAHAMHEGSRGGRAMVVMAFLAVLREGFETVVFLLAAFNETGNGAGPIAGAALGIAVAVGLGYALYRGGVRLNLSRFFRTTGLVLVAVAAGLVVTALHTAHEAGWLDAGQRPLLNLSWLVSPGSVQSSLLTGILGVQPRPVVAEVVGWLLYLVPVGLYVGWPASRGLSRRTSSSIALAAGALALAGSLTFALVAPGLTRLPVSADGARLLAFDTTSAQLQTGPAAAPVTLQAAGTSTLAGLTVERYTATVTRSLHDSSLPSRLTPAAAARRNGGRLPLGVAATASSLPVRYTEQARRVALVDPDTGRVVSLSTRTSRDAALVTSLGAVPLDRALSTQTVGWSPAAVASAVAAARADTSAAASRTGRVQGAWLLLVAGLVLLAAGTAGLLRRAPRRDGATALRAGVARPVRLG